MSIDSVAQFGGSERAIVKDVDSREYWTYWRVRTTTATDGPVTVLTAPGLPQIWDPFLSGTDSDPDAQLVEKIPQRDPEQPHVWEVQCHYSFDSVFTIPVQLDVSTDPIKVALQDDIDGNAIVNAGALDLFLPPPETDKVRWKLRASKNFSYFDQLTYAEFMKRGGAINSDTFWGMGPGLVHIAQINGQEFPTNVPYYWRITFEFWIDLDGWQLKILNAGYRAYIDGTLQLVRDHGIPRSEPTLLEADGTPLPAGSAPYFKPFDIYNSMAFAALNLGL